MVGLFALLLRTRLCTMDSTLKTHTYTYPQDAGQRDHVTLFLLYPSPLPRYSFFVVECGLRPDARPSLSPNRSFLCQALGPPVSPPQGPVGLSGPDVGPLDGLTQESTGHSRREAAVRINVSTVNFPKRGLTSNYTASSNGKTHLLRGVTNVTFPARGPCLSPLDHS